MGFDYKINEKLSENNEKEKLSLSVGQVFSYDKHGDLPTKSSLDQKMSDVVGELNYNFSEIGNIDYKFSLDHNYKNLNYNNISTSLNFGLVKSSSVMISCFSAFSVFTSRYILLKST